MITSEMAVFTKGWTAGQRVNLLKEAVQEYDCAEFFPWKELLATDFFVAPASTKYHGTYAGGLFDHSLNVANVLCYLTGTGMTDPWERPESPFLVGIFHDSTKIGKYAVKSTGDGFEWHIDKNWPIYGGHGAESVIRTQEWIQLTQEEILCIRFHMGAYEHDDWDAFDMAIKKYPNVLWTHQADMIASKILEKKEELNENKTS